MKLTNDYTAILGPLYERTPKAVFAAVAFSLAMRLNEDRQDAAVSGLLAEWRTLHANGIVPQAPKEAR